MAIVLDGSNGITTNSGTVISASTIGVGGATPSTSGAGITFPATQSASTDANTLDDYEEGSWTPTDGSGASLSLTVNDTPRYTKIGNIVIACASITYPSTANGNGNQINGLPFTANATAGYYGGFIRFTTASANVLVIIDPSSSYLRFYSNAGNRYTNAQLSTLRFDVVLVYQV